MHICRLYGISYRKITNKPTKIQTTLRNLKKSIDKTRNICYTLKVVWKWLVGQAVKTPASHAGNAGSIPARVTRKRITSEKMLDI